jgi:hypothetical protein
VGRKSDTWSYEVQQRKTCEIHNKYFGERRESKGPADEYGTDDFIGGCTTVQESHRGRTVLEVHDSVGDFEPREIGDSCNDVSDGTRKINN